VLFELALVFCGRIFTRLRPPPSARFSRINHRSRNQSPPCLVVDGSARRFRQATTIHLSTPRRQLGFPATLRSGLAESGGDGRDSLGGTWGCGDCAAVGCGPEMRWPLRALAVAETRPQGPAGRVGAGHEVRASPEMRPGSHDDWAATPQASLSHLLRRQTVPRWLLYVTRNLKVFCPPVRRPPRNPSPDGVSARSDLYQQPPNTRPEPHDRHPRPDNDGHAASSKPSVAGDWRVTGA
jgi:hypothetical protein